jgi:excisionase family DNA binding protein
MLRDNAHVYNWKLVERGVAMAAVAEATLTADLLKDGSLTIAQACREFGLSKSKIYMWMGEGRLPYTMATGRRLIPRKSLVELLAAGLVGASGGAK